MRKFFAVLAVVISLGAMLPALAQAADNHNDAQFHDSGAGAGAR